MALIIWKVYTHCLFITSISSRFDGNSEAFASELLANLEEMYPSFGTACIIATLIFRYILQY